MRIPAHSRLTQAAPDSRASTPSRRSQLDRDGLLDSRYELPTTVAERPSSLHEREGNWELTLFGNNLTDEVYGNYASRFGGAFWDTPTGVPAPSRRRERSALGVTRGRPREYGVSFQYNFGGGVTAGR